MEKYYALQYHDNIKNEITNHGIFQTEQDAYDSILAWWELNSFKPNYVRSFSSDEKVSVIDYGFHHYFYKIFEITQENFYDVLKLGGGR